MRAGMAHPLHGRRGTTAPRSGPRRMPRRRCQHRRERGAPPKPRSPASKPPLPPLPNTIAAPRHTKSFLVLPLHDESSTIIITIARQALHQSNTSTLLSPVLQSTPPSHSHPQNRRRRQVESALSPPPGAPPPLHSAAGSVAAGRRVGGSEARGVGHTTADDSQDRRCAAAPNARLWRAAGIRGAGSGRCARFASEALAYGSNRPRLERIPAWNDGGGNEAARESADRGSRLPAPCMAPHPHRGIHPRLGCIRGTATRVKAKGARSSRSAQEESWRSRRPRQRMRHNQSAPLRSARPQSSAHRVA